MIIRSTDLEPGHRIEADLCIVGAGAAGITLASHFAKGGASVCVLAGGGMEVEHAAQALYQGNYSGEVPTLDSKYLSDSRFRTFGGTTRRWAGYCRPLETIDFEQREWVPRSGWPLLRSELDPYYDAASDFLGIARFAADNADADQGRSYFEGPDTCEKTFRFRPHPWRFGSDHRRELEDSKNVMLYLDGNAMEFIASPSGRSIESLRASTLSGKKFSVRARQWVIAAGGIENARLLLASDAVQRDGLGNQNDQVGRHFMEHSVVHRGLGPLAVWRRFPVDLYRRHGEKDERANFVYPTEALARREKLLSISISFEAAASTESFSLDDRAVVAATRRLDGAREASLQKDQPALLRTVFMCESAPNPQSRVRLIQQRDALGMRRVDLDWRLTGLEVDTIQRFADLMSRRIAELGMGRMKVAPEKDELIGLLSPNAHHHMGTTRMHDDPKQGVVDANCRVHGIGNLYLAGSSVFPTSGAANPTFTLIALALRLAEHLEPKLGER